MKIGVLYGIGVGPGDPDLITMRGVAILSVSRHVFVTRSQAGGDRTALTIVEKHIPAEARIYEIEFPATAQSVEDAALRIAEILETGEDVCVIGRGDILLYTSYTRVIKALYRRIPDVEVVTVPGVAAFSSAAALSNFPLGSGKEQITIVPVSDDQEAIRRAVTEGGTVVLLNIGRRLGGVLDVLETAGALGRSVFVSHSGSVDQSVEKDLANLRGRDVEIHHFSTILIKGKREESL